MNKLKTNSGFTLVELIIVITILSVLWTIWFVSFQWYTKNARDSSRLANLKSIEQGLTLYKSKTWNYPNPDNKVNGVFEWNTLFYTWEVWEFVSSTIWSTWVPVDPSTQETFLYWKSSNWQYYQLVSFQEWKVAYNQFVNNAYADSKTAHVIWNYQGILLNSNKLYNPPSLILASFADTNIDTETLFITNNKNILWAKTLDIQSKPLISKDTPDIKNWESTKNELVTDLWTDSDVLWQLLYKDKYNNWNVIFDPRSLTKKIIWDDSSWRKWSDNSFASSCSWYKIPGNWESYSWDIWDWIYLIKPDSNPAFKVYCDMTFNWWWWTLVVNSKSWDFENLYSNNAIWNVYDINTLNTSKLSTEYINKIMLSWSSKLRIEKTGLEKYILTYSDLTSNPLDFTSFKSYNLSVTDSLWRTSQFYDTHPHFIIWSSISTDNFISDLCPSWCRHAFTIYNNSTWKLWVASDSATWYPALKRGWYSGPTSDQSNSTFNSWLIFAK